MAEIRIKIKTISVLHNVQILTMYGENVEGTENNQYQIIYHNLNVEKNMVLLILQHYVV